MTPCSTLEQRWSACREIDPQLVRGRWTHPRWAEWHDQWNACARWWIAPTGDRRPCTSPRRHQCKSDFWCPWDTQDTYCDDRPDA